MLFQSKLKKRLMPQKNKKTTYPKQIRKLHQTGTHKKNLFTPAQPYSSAIHHLFVPQHHSSVREEMMFIFELLSSLNQFLTL